MGTAVNCSAALISHVLACVLSCLIYNKMTMMMMMMYKNSYYRPRALLFLVYYIFLYYMLGIATVFIS